MPGPDHSTAGAVYAVRKLNHIGRILAYIIAGHHAGLPDWSYDEGKGKPLHKRLSDGEARLQEALNGDPPPEICNPIWNKSLTMSTPCIYGSDSRECLHLWIRLLFSGLIDGDRLDTEAFMNPEKAVWRYGYPTLVELKKKYDAHMAEMERTSPDIPINQKRKQILERCREVGLADLSDKQTGVYSLTVPTGGGKTLSSMGFALEHALKYGKKRIFVVIPYTSIIEQTAKDLRKVFGIEAVLEHHCNLDPEKESNRSRLAVENWDAPIIVTTNVQFFESLFAARTSACRKIHNIANSVVILDEAQTLPTDFLDPIVSVMKGLVRYFKTSIVLCTATQPVLNQEIISGPGKKLRGFGKDEIQEIMLSPKKLYDDFQRVSVSMYTPKASHWVNKDKDKGEAGMAEEIANQLLGYEQVLCIVNTKSHARTLFELVKARSQDGVPVIHLSASMCPVHRSDVVATMKERLKKREPIRVISTQVVEVGVNIDFPVVYREMAGLDSIAQAAGRCNREGKLKRDGKLVKGEVVVFDSQDIPKMFTKACDACREVFRHRYDPQHPERILSPENFEIYFQNYFYRLNDFDKEKIMTLLTNDANECKIQFRTAAARFKLIEDANQHSVIVWYQGKSEKELSEKELDSVALISELKKRGISRDLMRKLQRFSINVYDQVFQHLQSQGLIREVFGIWVQEREGMYDEEFGLKPDYDPTNIL